MAKIGDWYKDKNGDQWQYYEGGWENDSKRFGGVAFSTSTSTANEVPQPAYKTEEEVKTIKLSIPKLGDAKKAALRYPSEPPMRDDSDYVIFRFYKYAPPFGGGRDTDKRADSNSPSKTSNAPWGYSNYQDSVDRSYANESKLKSIILYMPEDIQTQFGAGWNGAGFGAAAAGMLGLAGSINTQKDFGAMLKAAGSSIAGGVKAATFQGLLSGINAIAGANINLNQALGSVTGTIINPNVELLYEAPKLRNFSLKFKLMPRTQQEAKDIRAICNTFKKSMLPSFGGQSIFGAVEETANMLTIPDLCQVSFMKGSSFHPYLPKYKICGITSVDINYTAAGAYASLSDGSPVATELTLSFLESKIIFAQEIEEDGSGI